MNNYLNGVYEIKSIFNGQKFKVFGNDLVLNEIHSPIRLVNIVSNYYYIETIFAKRRLAIDENNQIHFYEQKNIDNGFINHTIWEIIKVNIEHYAIKNKYSQKFLEANNNYNIKCLDIFNFVKINNSFIFSFVKLYNEYNFNNKYYEIIKKEPVDIVIKYIDLSDTTLNREGINQIYKDRDHEELRYSVRSILENIPWIRKIYILMPNTKVRYFKEPTEINDKISYINDKYFLGYDSANIFAFTFNFYKLRHFGVSTNYIYMEDDFFIGKPLKKTDFFYYEEKTKKVVPFLLQKHFFVMNATEIEEKRNKLLKQNKNINPHSAIGWWISVYNSDLYFMRKFKFKTPFINTIFNHILRPENINDMKDIYDSIINYEYINETLYSKTRNILSLNQPQYVNSYQINNKKRYNHFIPYKYYSVENLNNANLLLPLYVINTGGNHEPNKRQFLLEQKIMQRRFKFKVIYESNNKLIKTRKTFYSFNLILKGLSLIIILKML